MDHYKKSLADAVASEELGDEEFKTVLQEHQKEMRELEGDIKELDERIKGLTGQRDDMKKNI